MADTTVYSIYAGYVPQLGLGPDGFNYGRESGTARHTEQGTRYDGTGKNLTSATAGLHPDGKLGVARVRGSIAWYEFSTYLKEVRSALKSKGGTELKEEMKELAQQWYSGGTLPGWRQGEEARNRTLYNAFEQLITDKNIQPTGEIIGGSEKAEPEEQAIRRHGGAGKSQWKEDDKTMREAGRIFGQANAIDVYFRDKKGDIHRLDVTAMTLDKKDAHHGLSSYEDRKESKVTGEALLNTIESAKSIEKGMELARKDLRKYFEKLRMNTWNPPIQSMKDIVRTNQMEGSNLLSDLESGEESLMNLSRDAKKKMKKLGVSIRGGGAPGRKTIKIGSGKNESIEETGKIGKGHSSGGFQAAANAIRKWYIDQASKIAAGMPNDYSKIGTGDKTYAQPKGDGASEAFNQGLEFALHMLGNVLELFSMEAGNRSARQGGYSTAFSMGKSEAAQNYIVEVQHNIHPSGKKVFEFKQMFLKDIFIHNEAYLTTEYQKKYWYEGEKTNRAVLIAQAIRQNQLATHQALGLGESNLEIGAIQHLAGGEIVKSGSLPVMTAGTGRTLPKRINRDIDKWLRNVTPKGNTFPAEFKQIRDRYRHEFGHSSDYLRQRGALAAGAFDHQGNAAREQTVRSTRGSRASIQHIDPLQNPGTTTIRGQHGLPVPMTGSNMQTWISSVQQTGGFGKGSKINASERAFQARMGLEHDDTIYTNLRKFMMGTQDEMRLGLSMAQGIAKEQHETGSGWQRAGGVRFWATPYLSVLYPSAQVRVK